LGLVFHQRAFAVVEESHGRATFGVACEAAATLPGKAISIGRGRDPTA
jgi:hypothetical protein